MGQSMGKQCGRGKNVLVRQKIGNRKLSSGFGNFHLPKNRRKYVSKTKKSFFFLLIALSLVACGAPEVPEAPLSTATVELRGDEVKVGVLAIRSGGGGSEPIWSADGLPRRNDSGDLLPWFPSRKRVSLHLSRKAP